MNKKWEAIAAVVAQAAKIETLVIGNCLQNLVLHFQIFQTGPFKFFCGLLLFLLKVTLAQLLFS